MKLFELDQIRKFLPSNFEIELKGTETTPSFIKDTWNHSDGSYNMRCEACGYLSGEYSRFEKIPPICPKCKVSVYKGA